MKKQPFELLFLIPIIMGVLRCSNKGDRPVISSSNANEVCECMNAINESSQIDTIKANITRCFKKLDTSGTALQKQQAIENAYDSLYNHCYHLNKLLTLAYVSDNKIDTATNIDQGDCLQLKNHAFLYYTDQYDTLFINDTHVLNKTKFGTEKHSIKWLNECTYQYEINTKTFPDKKQYVKVTLINIQEDTVTFKLSDPIVHNSYMKFILLH